MYTIIGASGNTGRHIAEKLLAQGQKIRVVGRDQEKLKSLAAKGAEIFEADLNDVNAIKKAFTGAKAAYLMIPPNYGAPDFRAYQNKIGETMAQAIKQSGVTHVINLSSVGAHMGYGIGVVLGLHDQENRLNIIDNIAVLHLRPSFFMENQLMQISTIKKMGVMGSPLKGEIKLPQIAIADIADYAVKRFLKLDFTGKSVQELLGPRDISFVECASIIGKAIDKPDLKYVEFPYEDTTNVLKGMGLSQNAAESMVGLYRGFNEGIARPTEPRTSENTTATTFEKFAETFAMLYKK
jgi:uncharacterized protein YbjT (DUF2867 family)